MTNLFNSELLDIVLDEAKKICNENDVSLTATVFLLSTMNLVEHFDISECADNRLVVDEECTEIVYFLRTSDLDVYRLKNILTNAVKEKNEHEFSEKLYMQKILYEAKFLAVELNCENLTALQVIECILETPSRDVNKIIREHRTQELEELFLINNNEDEDNDEEYEDKDKDKDKDKGKDTYVYNDGDYFETVNLYFGEKEGEIELSGKYDLPEFVWKKTKGVTASSIDRKMSEEAIFEDSHCKEIRGEITNVLCDVKTLEKRLRKDVFGQDSAINAVMSGYFHANIVSMIDCGRKLPRAVFLFAGPRGVGKTFMAETFAEILKLPFQRFDMNGYKDKDSDIKFCGINKMHPSSKEGDVTGFVRKYPKSVLLFDDIENAHISVTHLIMQIVDAGHMRDNFTDEDVSFRDTIIFLITNTGKQLNKESEKKNISSIPNKVIEKPLEKDIKLQMMTPHFPEEIASHLVSMNLVMFEHIEPYTLTRIAEKEINRQAQNFEMAVGIQIDVDDSVYSALLFKEGSKADARLIKGRAQSFFNEEIYELFRLVDSNKAGIGVETIERIRIDVDLDGCSENIKSLFRMEGKMNALVFAGEETLDICKKLSFGVNIIGTHSLDEAIDLIETNDIKFVLIDMGHNTSREFFRMIRLEKNQVPVYLVEREGNILSKDAKIILLKNADGEIVNIANGNDDFELVIKKITNNVQCKLNMNKLSEENKVITFETTKYISSDGKDAKIVLHDFGVDIVVD